MRKESNRKRKERKNKIGSSPCKRRQLRRQANIERRRDFYKPYHEDANKRRGINV